MRVGFKMLTVLSAAVTSTTAFAATVADGTLSAVDLFNPTVNLSSDPSTYSASNGPTYELGGSGAFASLSGTSGTLNGTLSFSDIAGTTIPEVLSNFFVFSDGHGGTYNYSVASVRTNTFFTSAGASSGTLLSLGTVIDSQLNETTPTPASLSIQFNNTGGSPYSSSLSFSVPPASALPELATWTMMIGGLGMIGSGMRRKRAAAAPITA